MDPATFALVTTVLGACGIKAVETILNGKTISISINRRKKVDYHAIRRMEIENGWEPTEVCEDPFCRECFSGITIDIEVKKRERIVDGYLVPVPGIVPDDAFAWTEVDNITENVKIYWSWVDSAGRDKKLRTMTPKIEVKEID